MSESGIVWKLCVSQKFSNCSNEQVDNYLDKNETHSKFKQSKTKFLRLKAQTFRLNKIWSVDLADMQQLARPNNGVNFLFVAVDTLSQFLWVRPIKRKTADSCRNALKEIISDIKDQTPNMQPLFCRATRGTTTVPGKLEKIWVDKGPEFASFRRNAAIDLYSTNSETKSALLSEIFAG